MQGVALQEEISQERVGEATENFEQNAEGRAEQIARTKALLNLLGMIAVIFLSLASETEAGIAYHQYWYHRLRVRVCAPYMKEHKKVLNQLSSLRQEYTYTKLKPDTLHAVLTRKGIRHDQKIGSFLPTLRWVAIGFFVFVGLIVFTSLSHGSTTTVALVDLSKSTPEFVYARYLETVTLLIRKTKGVQMRIVVFGINEKSFASEPLLNTTSPAIPGRFNEYIEQWQVKTISHWQAKTSKLKPTAKRSDIIGTLLRIGIEYETVPKDGLNQLYIYSDMRQVGKGLNFEERVGDVNEIFKSLKEQNLIPDLSGMDVWILGVHTEHITETRWLEIRAFWRRYFEEANAELKMFTPRHDFR